MEFLKVTPYPAMARFKFGGGRIGEVKYAADIKVGFAGCRGVSTAFVLEADIPALLRTGALGALGGQFDCERDISTIRNHGVDTPLRAHEMGHYVPSVVAFRQGPSRADRGPNLAASLFGWTIGRRALSCRLEAFLCPPRGMGCSAGYIPRLEYGGTLQTRIGGMGYPLYHKLQLRPSFRGVHFKRDLVHSKRVWQ